jgi:hypothetical protein
VADHYRGAPPESAAGVSEHALDSGVREEGDGWQVLPADAKDFEEAALRACECSQEILESRRYLERGASRDRGPRRRQDPQTGKKGKPEVAPHSAATLAEQKRVRELLSQSRALLKQMQAG